MPRWSEQISSRRTSSSLHAHEASTKPNRPRDVIGNDPRTIQKQDLEMYAFRQLRWIIFRCDTSVNANWANEAEELVNSSDRFNCMQSPGQMRKADFPLG